MKKIIPAITCVALVLTGCAGQGGFGNQNYGQPQYNNQSYQQSYSQRGRVLAVREFVTQQNNPNYLAIAGGALVGGILGNQVGRGTGKDLATIAGAAAGGYAGHELGKGQGQSITMVEIQVRLDNGSVATFTQPKNGNFYINQSVTIVNNGRNTVVNPY